MAHKRFFASITSKMVWLLILLILPFNLAALFTAMQSLANAREQTVLSMESLSGLAVQQLDSRIESANNFLYSLVRNREDFRVVSAQGEKNGNYYLLETSLSQYLSESAETMAFADGLFWYDSQGKAFLSLATMSDLDNLQTLYLKRAIQGWIGRSLGRYTDWSLAEIGGYYWIVRIFSIDDFYYGALFSLENMKNQIEESSSLSDIYIRFLTSEEEAQVPDNYLYVETLSKKSNLKINVRTPKNASFARLTRIQVLSIVLIGLYFLLIPLLIWAMHGIVLTPLRAVRDAMEHLKGGEQSYRIPVKKSSEEFELIDATFNEMADNIQTLKIENYEKELDRQKMELRNLQLQIRPHFLMNMFNLLYSFAQIENYQNIQKLALYLSDYFRHIFQSGKDLQPFDQEFLLIQKYLEISAMRYPDWYEVSYEIDPEALEVDVPPLLIHNFVENIFKHIINFDRKIHIHLEAYTTETEAVFVIADDGPGMEPQMAEDINRGIFPKEKTDRVHVGLANSYRRIRSIYGDRGSLSVESVLGEGTCFTIVIPREGET